MSNRFRHHHEVVIDELRNPEMAKSYLEVALEEYELDGDLSFFLEALRNVAEAQGGMTKLASKTGLNRQNLYRVLSVERKPGTGYYQSDFKGSQRSPEGFPQLTATGVGWGISALTEPYCNA